MNITRYAILMSLFLITKCCLSQTDSTLSNLKDIPVKYISTIDRKVDKYSSRITSKTEKTLEKLSCWEEKIKRMLQKVSPTSGEQLFGSGQQTFGTVLQRIKEGKRAIETSQIKYDEYRDKLTTNLAYLSIQKENLNQKILNPLNATKVKVDSLSRTIDDAGALDQFIKERKKLLFEQSFQYIGKSKYITKINKEAYYYSETLKNYKEIFSDPEKTEQTVQYILSKIPAFEVFRKQNSILAGLFDISTQSGQIIPGMQTRSSVQQLIQGRLSTMGVNAQQIMSNNLQAAQGALSNLKSKISNGSSNSENLDFKPNNQKTKTLAQRIEYGTNIQFSKTNGIAPSGSNIALSLGYKLNTKSIIGIGTSYSLGIGNIQHIRFSTEGIGIRSFIDWQLKKQFFISGGFEMNYLTRERMRLQNTSSQGNYVDGMWQKAALMGIQKKLQIKTKWFKSTNVQLLYDFLSNQHIPISQPIIFRTGYNF